MIKHDKDLEKIIVDHANSLDAKGEESFEFLDEIANKSLLDTGLLGDLSEKEVVHLVHGIALEYPDLVEIELPHYSAILYFDANTAEQLKKEYKV